ncbi:hypothetical protein CONCODRAFT_14990 [Conidiobolus coronatus NRRL 28638]|uniref:G-protein coupled receptors family 1 profile domain-containing protein n=1 Tax=Conidiobolus coronatus (strain ATCC 28846 / CBS 209.66 / NRRL 28638) TaxID=796925 RepID=A0A137PGI0_CONC2|nr:hypothetical protein CONCODRAFT_14990 [Conidiobolus coronatus NRRL 28638]|eukprot:KXN74104.1 hypothetical protein CONCODRAFT_14990 [Conidiobolus coronatus NRRL 28638]
MITIYQVTPILHPIGMACASLVLVTLLALIIYDRSLVNRVTLRLIGMVAVADIFTHTKDFLIKNHRENDGLCTFISAFTYFSTYLYCFTNIAVTYNFQRTFIQGINTTFRFEILTWIAVLTVSLGITIIFWLLGTFGFDPIQKKCVGITTNWVFYFRGNFQWVLCGFTVAYCTIVTLLIHFKLREYVSNYMNQKNFNTINEARHRKEITQLIQRGLLYPLSPIITQPPMIAYMVYYLFYNNSTEFIQWWLGIGYGLSGVLTAIAFFIDITLLKALNSIYRRIKYKDQNDNSQLQYYDIDPSIMMGDTSNSRISKYDHQVFTYKSQQEFLDLTKEL